MNNVADINSYIEYFTNHGYDIKPELFYNKQLLDTIRLSEDNYVHYRYAETSPIQNKAAKLQIRRWAPLQAHTTPLSEGVAPKSDKGSMESYEIPAYQYGRYMEFTDKVDFEVIDPVIAHYTQEYSLVAMETLDLLARETLLTVGSNSFANQKANAGALEVTDVPELVDLRVIVLGMKKSLVKPRSNGKFHVIGTPDFFFDMIQDATVEKYMTINQTTSGFYDMNAAPIPPMFGMEFYETLATNTSGEWTNATDTYLRVYRLNTDTELYEYDNLDATTYLTVSAGYVQDSRTGEDASYLPENRVWDLATYNATAAADGFGEFVEMKINRILVLGKDALLRTGIQGEDNAKVYVKGKGSTGVLDPIDQRQSIGFKINSVGFGSTRLEAVAIYNCVPTQANNI